MNNGLLGKVIKFDKERYLKQYANPDAGTYSGISVAATPRQKADVAERVNSIQRMVGSEYWGLTVPAGKIMYRALLTGLSKMERDRGINGKPGRSAKGKR